jgi:hypothetical protein
VEQWFKSDFAHGLILWPDEPQTKVKVFLATVDGKLP